MKKMMIVITAVIGSWCLLTGATQHNNNETKKEGFTANECRQQDQDLYQLPNGLLFNSMIR
jgi:hypothetical protein